MAETRLTLLILLVAVAVAYTSASAASSSNYVSIVKALMASGTCASVTTNSSICGNSSRAYSYYDTFEYNSTYRVTITAGVPDHEAEYDQTKSTPNERCVRYQYMVTPYTPSMHYNYYASNSSGYTIVPMGVMGITTSGTPIYNPLSQSNGSLASYYEWDTLDPCYGHTDQDYQYHYHAISSCITDATTASTNTLIGYFIDGYPMYGYSEVNGVELKSCWYSTYSSPTLISEFTYNSTGYTAGTCHLDYANGYNFTSGYGYVMTSANYYVPYYYAGLKYGYTCGFTP
jgi:hypothetical protein